MTNILLRKNENFNRAYHGVSRLLPLSVSKQCWRKTEFYTLKRILFSVPILANPKSPSFKIALSDSSVNNKFSGFKSPIFKRYILLVHCHYLNSLIYYIRWACINKKLLKLEILETKLSIDHIHWMQMWNRFYDHPDVFHCLCFCKRFPLALFYPIK